MKITLESPVWYSTDKLYVSNVVETDGTLSSEPTDITNAKLSVAPTATAQDHFLDEIAPLLFSQIKSWFSATLTLEKLRKKMVCEFKDLTIAPEPRWVSFVWVPKHFSIETRLFKLLFSVQRMEDQSPRIPITFLEEEAPAVATEAAPIPSVLDEIPYSTDPPIALRSTPWQEKQQLQHAKLRAAIARLKVEELRENYIRNYGEEEESDEEEETDDDSEPKK